MNSKALPARTDLYRVSHVVGDDLESLGSYLLRLAARHQAPLNALISYLRRSLNSKISAMKWHHGVSGAGFAAREGAVAIAMATGQPSMHQMTLMPLDLLVRDCWDEESKWCPECVREYDACGLAYVPLRWSINGLDVCVRHAVRLDRRCRCGDRNSPRLHLSACSRCHTSLAETIVPSVSASPADLVISKKIEEFLTWTNAATTADSHRGRFLGLREMIDWQDAVGVGAEVKSNAKLGRSVFARPALADVARFAAAKGVAISSLFDLGGGTKICWTAPVTHARTEIDWTPIFAAARDAAAAGIPMTIEAVERQFNVPTATLRITFNRHGVPWQKVRLLCSAAERQTLEVTRDELFRAAARQWLAQGGSRRFRTFYEHRTPALGPWSWRAKYRTRYKQIFADECAGSIAPPARLPYTEIDWGPIEAAASIVGPIGRRPTAIELADAFNIPAETLRTHFRRNGLLVASAQSNAPVGKARARWEIEQLSRDRMVRSLSETWLAEGNHKSFPAMVRGIGSKFPWLQTAGSRSRYRKLFRSIAWPVVGP